MAAWVSTLACVILHSLLVLSAAHINEPNTGRSMQESNLRPAARDALTTRAPPDREKQPTTEARLEADGFLKDKHSESDLANKLRAIYERYYELADRLKQAQGHSGELTKQLIQTKLDLANYKVYKHDLIKRLKKTEMYLTVLIKKSRNESEEHEIDLNEKFDEDLTEGEVKAGGTTKKLVPISSSGFLKDDPDFRAKTEFSRIGMVNLGQINGEDTGHSTKSDNLNTTETVALDNQNKKTTNNTSEVLAQISFNFLKKSPAKVKLQETMALRNGFYGDIKTHAEAGLVIKIGGTSQQRGDKEANLEDGDFGANLGSSGFRVFNLIDEDRVTSYQYVRGEPGSAGVPGVPGPSGAPGSSGPAGPTGLAGPVGGVGTKGEPGRGTPGTNGLNGVPGVQGATGYTGQTGVPGPNGATGVKGTIGVRGPMGQQGVQGIVGDP